MTRIKSLRELSEELTGIRLSAAGTSMWYLGATLSERARVAINDAFSKYNTTVRGLYRSAVLSSAEPIVLPANIKSVIEVRAKLTSGYSVVEVSDIRHVPTTLTNLLYVNRTPYKGLGGAGLEIETLEEAFEYPPNLALSTELSKSLTYVQVTGGVPEDTWIQPGFIEITAAPHIDTTAREIVWYWGCRPDTFTGVERGIEGQARVWEAGSVVSFAQKIPPGLQSVIQEAAQANMYKYWLGHRAQYDQYTSVAGIETLDIGTLLAMIRSLEASADRAYRALSVKKIPPVTRVKRRGRRGGH